MRENSFQAKLIKDLKSLFDGAIFSCDYQMVKPDKEFYSLLLNKYSLDPKETIFIDDLESNLDGARKVGLDTYLFNKNKIDEFIEFINKNELE